ncbi:MAG: hypothetical protein PHE29_12535, partial [Tissierellia bacterium]|nr:hypothetical protein [Tissierellia bacterium]
MFYSEISCDTEESMKKFIDSKIEQMIDFDYFSFVTVTFYKKVVVNGQINHSDIDNSEIVCFIEENHEEIYKLNTGKLYYSYEYCNKFDAIIVPIREFRNYKVYCLCCK